MFECQQIHQKCTNVSIHQKYSNVSKSIRNVQMSVNSSKMFKCQQIHQKCPNVSKFFKNIQMAASPLEMFKCQQIYEKRLCFPFYSLLLFFRILATQVWSSLSLFIQFFFFLLIFLSFLLKKLKDCAHLLQRARQQNSKLSGACYSWIYYYDSA